jgi:tetratricopeptide (TPR) repeat protein
LKKILGDFQEINSGYNTPNLIKSRVTLGRGLRLISPRNTYVRPDQDIFLEFKAPLKGDDSFFEYKISLIEKNKKLLKKSNKIEKDDFVLEKLNNTIFIKVKHLLDYHLLVHHNEYRWKVETKHEINDATFKILDDYSLIGLKLIEKELDKVEDKNSKASFLGSLYESVNLYDDAIQKYNLLIDKDPSNIKAYQRLGILYAKKASKAFVLPNIDPTNLSNKDIQNADLDLANEANKFYEKVQKLEKEVL